MLMASKLNAHCKKAARVYRVLGAVGIAISNWTNVYCIKVNVNITMRLDNMNNSIITLTKELAMIMKDLKGIKKDCEGLLKSPCEVFLFDEDEVKTLNRWFICCHQDRSRQLMTRQVNRSSCLHD